MSNSIHMAVSESLKLNSTWRKIRADYNPILRILGLQHQHVHHDVSTPVLVRLMESLKAMTKTFNRRDR
jgi:hypothetical protein